ncbi:serine hydrolase [uncultured Aquimarina sp.]|uniref:serine hydrolase domain-containing protein n=1 Tax=uncultured Aquimarina sp. TaxID=575652 RepID=UPI00262603D5|nr:serine hydrolase [uncultured Aquimarina sp.]
MYKKVAILIFFIASISSSCAQQNIKDYIGEWEGKTTNTNDLNLNIAIELKGEDAVFKLSNSREILSKNFKLEKEVKLSLDENLSFRGLLNSDKSMITGFMRIKKDLYPTKLYKKGNRYVGKWNLSALYYLQPNDLKLKMKEVNDDGYTVYPMLGSFWVSGFKQKDDTISFEDYKTGLDFEGILKPSEIILNIKTGDNLIASASFKKAKKVSSYNKTTLQINDGWDLSKNQLVLPKMEEGIHNNSLVGIESVIVAKNDKIIYENYFADFNAKIPHGMRSASKSISSAIIGIAIDDKIIESVDEKLYDFIPQEYQYTKDSMKSKITIKDLLTMSSGLDVNNKAYEGYYQDESDDSWLKTVLEAPMVHESGTYTDYGSANPFLLGISLNERLDIPLEFYMDNKLFAPLGIANYIMNTDDTGIIPYFGGGLYLTPRDMLKFGQLYLNKGTWQGKRIISEDWVEESFKKHTRLQDVRDKNEYGYQWWHDTYMINGETIKTIEARGAGGQRIILIPELESVVVITAGNYRNRKSNLSGEIFRDYVLPAIKN